MARLLADHRPGPAKSDIGGESNEWANATITLTSFVLLFVLVMPVALVGMLIVYAVWKITRPTWLTIVVLSLGCAAALVVEANMVAWLWPWGLLIPNRLFGVLPSVSALPLGSVVERSCAIELQAGPLLLLMVEALLAVREKTIHAGIFAQAREGESGIAATLKDHLRHYASIVSPQSPSSVTSAHPPGGIRLGVDKDNRRKAFDLTVADLRLHTFLPGATGSGKTTTLERIADGAMANGYGLVIIDCKGGSLEASASKLATLHNVPFILVDPREPTTTVGYNPCSGSPSDIANKLIGSFTFGEAGEIYKQVGMHVVPIIVRGLLAAGVPVTLDSLANACDANGLRLLAHKIETGEEAPEQNAALADELTAILDDTDVAGRSGVVSLKHRFGALLQGAFAPLFAAKHSVLDWDEALATPSVVYVSLPVTAASEDVELMGRVLLQDLKQVCSRRLRQVGAGAKPNPVLVAIDEFAGLKDAKQIIDLLLQARQAEMPLLLATQFFPQDPDLKKAVLQSGLLIAHRLESSDAEELAAQFGTRPRWKVTFQQDWQTGMTEKGSVRDVEEYVIHPNTLRSLPVGAAAVRAVPSQRHAIVEVIATIATDAA
jgi:hypothetical protein